MAPDAPTNGALVKGRGSATGSGATSAGPLGGTAPTFAAHAASTNAIMAPSARHRCPYRTSRTPGCSRQPSPASPRSAGNTPAGPQGEQFDLGVIKFRASFGPHRHERHRCTRVGSGVARPRLALLGKPHRRRVGRRTRRIVGEQRRSLIHVGGHRRREFGVRQARDASPADGAISSEPLAKCTRKSALAATEAPAPDHRVAYRSAVGSKNPNAVPSCVFSRHFTSPAGETRSI